MTFVQSWALISCLYNDTAIYNIELFRTTVTTYATARLALFYIVFNLGFVSMAAIVGQRVLARTDYSFSRETIRLKNIKLVGYIVIVLMILYIAYSFAAKGIPLLAGLHRHAFFQQTNPLEKILIVQGFVLAFALGYFRSKKKIIGPISLNGLLLFFYMIFAVLIGNKFSAFLLLLIPYFAPVYARRFYNNTDFSFFKIRYAVALIVQSSVGLFFFIILYYLHYSIIYRHPLRAIVTIVVLIPYLTVLFTGNFAVFFTFGMAVKILILLLLEIGPTAILAGKR